MNAAALAKAFRTAERFGSDKDDPEGCRWVRVSDTLATEIADYLESLVFTAGDSPPPPDPELHFTRRSF